MKQHNMQFKFVYGLEKLIYEHGWLHAYKLWYEHYQKYISMANMEAYEELALLVLTKFEKDKDKGYIADLAQRIYSNELLQPEVVTLFTTIIEERFSEIQEDNAEAEHFEVIKKDLNSYKNNNLDNQVLIQAINTFLNCYDLKNLCTNLNKQEIIRSRSSCCMT